MGRPRYQRRKEDRPQEIAEAAFAAFAEKGFTATKVEDVARRAGVSKGLLYLYFKTKEAPLSSQNRMRRAGSQPSSSAASDTGSATSHS